MNKTRPIWRRKTRYAYQYTRNHVVPAEDPVRPDDVIQVLEPTLEVTSQLRKRLAQKKLREKYWYQRFGDLLIDTFWDELAEEKESA
jgi:sulfite reductase beta subunit-like hemoprotein